MKKLTLSILALLALTLTGCEESTQEQIDADVASHIQKVNYEGHKYLLYQLPNGYQGYGGITHDPDCPCHNKQSNEE